MKKADLHAENLKGLQEYLLSRGWNAFIAPADPVQNYDRISVHIYNRDQTVFWPAELLFLPGLEKDMPEHTIMQLYIPMVVNVPAAMEIGLAEMVTRINTKLALGGFGLLNDYHVLFYKHNTLLADVSIGQQFDLVHQTLLMASYLLVNFQDAFANVVSGKMSIPQAMDAMPFANLYK